MVLHAKKLIASKTICMHCCCRVTWQSLFAKSKSPPDGFFHTQRLDSSSSDIHAPLLSVSDLHHGAQTSSARRAKGMTCLSGCMICCCGSKIVGDHMPGIRRLGAHQRRPGQGCNTSSEAPLEQGPTSSCWSCHEHSTLSPSIGSINLQCLQGQRNSCQSDAKGYKALERQLTGTAWGCEPAGACSGPLRRRWTASETPPTPVRQIQYCLRLLLMTHTSF